MQPTWRANMHQLATSWQLQHDVSTSNENLVLHFNHLSNDVHSSIADYTRYSFITYIINSWHISLKRRIANFHRRFSVGLTLTTFSELTYATGHAMMPASCTNCISWLHFTRATISSLPLLKLFFSYISDAIYFHGEYMAFNNRWTRPWLNLTLIAGHHWMLLRCRPTAACRTTVGSYFEDQFLSCNLN